MRRRRRRRRRALGRDHLDQRGLTAVSFQCRKKASKALEQGAVALNPSIPIVFFSTELLG